MIFERLNFGVGPILKGMGRSKVREILGDFDEFSKNSFAKNTTDNFSKHRVHVFYSEYDIVEGVEFMSGANLSIGGIKVFDENLEDFLKKASDNGLNFERDDLGAVLPDVEASLFCPDGFYIKSVYFEL
ncbi:hypothetical protein FYK61_09320 [Xanthomonas citri]|uniref:hypothetical protein n=1 Tax=Xanthomonas citri TaxID=346 RepID=UPI001885428A|nr:hypothetical protein [Xanthomonas citri]QOY21603.1 hypothetical protein FYK61_09320 [Xanthomonas citri]QQK67733.1 hypothetical protein G3566_09310 [Xanthomonas citri]